MCVVERSGKIHNSAVWCWCVDVEIHLAGAGRRRRFFWFLFEGEKRGDFLKHHHAADDKRKRFDVFVGCVREAQQHRFMLDALMAFNLS